MRGFRQVLVKVVLFQLRGRGYPQDDATPNFFPDSKIDFGQGAAKISEFKYGG